MTLLPLEMFYALIAVIFGVLAIRVARDATHPRRLGSALFWAVLAVIFGAGKALPPVVVGWLVLGIAVLAALKQVGPSGGHATTREARAAEAARLGNKLLWPALIVPAAAIVGSQFFDRVKIGRFVLLEPRHAAIVSVGLGAVLAVMVALRLTRARANEPLQEGGRLVEAIGWALVLPQLLAALGGIFSQAGVGPVVADLVGRALPTQFPFVAVAAYCLGMMLFTICMGNAFAAFAVITGGIGLPLIVQQHHGNPAIMAAIGMLSGYCGTLITPMAANFNVVPAMLLELPDKNGVIKAQFPMALVIFGANVLLMYFCVYRF